MAITAKTRKLLWGRSGNRCAICKCDLVVEATSSDEESVVGDECHIVSRSPNGPRFDCSMDASKIDEYENLILLCRVHHKQIDDQEATFTREILQNIKSEHEVWANRKLSESTRARPLRIRRLKKNIPRFLHHLVTGRDAIAVIDRAHAHSFDHDELRSQEETEAVAAFLQSLEEWGDLLCELGAGERVQVATSISEMIAELDGLGFWVFGATEVQLMEGGKNTPSDWIVSIVRVIRKENKSIIAGSSRSPDATL